MEFNLKDLDIQEVIKRIAALRGYNITSLGNEFNQRYGTKYNQQSFSRKLRSGSITPEEMKKFGDFLNFDVIVRLKE